MIRSDSTTDETIHNCLPVLRAERGLSRRDLAAAVGVHYQTIGYLERGEYSPSLALAFRIARYFELPLEAVFSDRPFEPLSRTVYGAAPPAAEPPAAGDDPTPADPPGRTSP